MSTINYPNNSEAIKAKLIEGWPNLSKTKFEVTSCYSEEYNCLAYAAGEDDRWWSPLPSPGYYWPPGIPRKNTWDSFIAAYATLGFELCEDGQLEEGYEKLAIYGSEFGRPKHVAIQLSDGTWSSKLGKLQDINHELLGLEVKEYSQVQRFMKRSRA